jgi:hypothetical protein
MYKKRPEDKPVEHQSDSKKGREKELLLHELFEAELNSDSEATVVHDRKSDNQPATFLEKGEDETTAVESSIEIDIELPRSSDEEFLPLFAPPVTKPLIPVPKKLPRNNPSRSAGENTRNSKELEDIYDLSSDASPSAPRQTPLSGPKIPLTPEAERRVFAATPPSSTSTPSESHGKYRFSKGETGGIKPLDISEFETTSPARRSKSHDREKRVLIISGPAPMASSSRISKRGFTLSLRDILLIALLIMLGFGIWIGWQIYKDIQIRDDLKKVKELSKIIEDKKLEELTKIKQPPPSKPH